jgi:hypothetical protein
VSSSQVGRAGHARTSETVRRNVLVGDFKPANGPNGGVRGGERRKKNESGGQPNHDVLSMSLESVVVIALCEKKKTLGGLESSWPLLYTRSRTVLEKLVHLVRYQPISSAH